MIADPIAIRIRRDIERASVDQIRAFERMQTSFVADAQQGWNCLHHSIKPLFATKGVVGTAVTASGGPRDLLAAMVMLDVAHPGDVMVIATDGDESGAVVGDVWAAIAKKKGVVAVVTDGLVRDTAGIESVDLATFSRGACPNGGYKNGPGQVNFPVSIGGVCVTPGDIVVGDRDGVVIVPRAQADEVAVALAQVVGSESETEERLAKGELSKLWDEDQYETRGVKYIR